MSAPAAAERDPDGPGRADGSRERLLIAAAELARERGVDGATISALCQRSELPVSSVYWHFADKDALFAAVIRSDYERWIASAPRWDFGSEIELVEGIRLVLTQTTGSSMRQVPDFIRIGMQLILDQRDVNQKARAEFRSIRHDVRDMILGWAVAALAREGVANPRRLAEQLATLVIGVADGLVVGTEIYEDWDAAPYVELFLDSVAAIVAAHRG